MDFSGKPIQQLIPQRQPILMVDKVVSCEEVDALTEFAITEGNIFLEGDVLSAPGIIENMAQSCAARMGCIDIIHGEPIKIGYIGDIKDCEIIRRPHCNETLHTHVHVIEDFFNLLLAEVKVMVKDECIAEARVKVARTDIVANLSE